MPEKIAVSTISSIQLANCFDHHYGDFTISFTVFGEVIEIHNPLLNLSSTALKLTLGEKKELIAKELAFINSQLPYLIGIATLNEKNITLPSWLDSFVLVLKNSKGNSSGVNSDNWNKLIQSKWLRECYNLKIAHPDFQDWNFSLLQLLLTKATVNDLNYEQMVDDILKITNDAFLAPTLMTFLNHPSLESRAWWLKKLSARKIPGLEKAIKDFRQDAPLPIRKVLCGVLINLNENKFKMLVRKLMADEEPSVRLSALDAVKESKTVLFDKEIINRLKDHDDEIRKTAIRVLSKKGGEKFGQYYVRMLNDENYWVQNAANIALTSCKNKDIQEALIKKLNHRKRSVQLMATKTWITLDHPMKTAWLIHQLNTKGPVVQEEVLKYFTTLNISVEDPEFLETIKKLANSRYKKIKAAASKLLKVQH